MAGASMTDMLWNNSFDANSQDLAQAKEYLSQFKDQTYIDKEGKVQNYFVAKENDYTKPYINLYEAAFSGVSNVSDYLKSGITQSPYQGIMDKIKNATDHALNNKTDTAKAVGSEIKNSLSDCANSPLKCGSNILQSIGNGIIDGTYGLAYNTMPSLANDLNSFYGFTASDYLTALSAANILGSGLEATGAVGLGKLAKDGVVAIGKAGAKGVNLVKNTNFTDAALSSIVKLDQLITIKGVQTINIGGKEYAVVGHNPLTKNYIIRPTGVIKEEKVLVGNHYEVTQDGLLAVGKNALQRSGIKTISKQEFKKASDFSIVNNPAMTIEYINSYLPGGVPDATIADAIGYATYQFLHPEEFGESIIDIYNTIRKSGKKLVNAINTDNSKTKE
jgi:hypothetical protein